MRRRGVRSLVAVLLFVCVIWMAPLHTGATSLVGYSITNYDVDIVVHEDNSYDVTETIDVEFTANRHGIFRSIPIASSSGFPAQVRNLNVEGAPFTVERDSGLVVVRIGDPNRFADAHMRYVISYNYYVGDDNNPEFDEFYFNIIGTEWDTSIANVTFSVEMPKPFDENDLNITAGAYGSIAGIGYLAYEVEGNTIIGRTVQFLMPGEGLTIALPLPEGYFSEVSPRTDWGEVFAWVGFVVFPLIAAGIAALWYRWRRNNKIFPSVQFYPPQHMTSADVGFILDGMSSTREITSLLIYWAGKGNITIEEVSKKQLFGSNTSYIFTKIRDLDPSTAKTYEQVLFTQLFALGDGTTVTSKQLENKLHEHIAHAQAGVKAHYTDVEDSRVVAKTNVPFTLLGGLLAFLMGLLVAGIASQPRWIHDLGELVYLAVIAVLAVLMIGMFYLLWKPFTDKEHASPATWLFAVVMALAALLVVLVILVLTLPNLIKAASALLGFAALGTAGWFLSTPYRRTPLGDDYKARILGFREFLRVAEKPRLEALLEDNPAYFYDTLPFALVLGVTDKWADKFKDIEMSAPDWYISPMGGPFMPILFMTSMSSSLNALNTVATSSPAQSGGSMGGGFSGGGFGGGGGGSW